ncbi:hypothetical protein BDW62DRAFT_52012 [Aspergillus aurantiobrunneus]
MLRGVLPRTASLRRSPTPAKPPPRILRWHLGPFLHCCWLLRFHIFSSSAVRAANAPLVCPPEEWASPPVLEIGRAAIIILSACILPFSTHYPRIISSNVCGSESLLRCHATTQCNLHSSASLAYHALVLPLFRVLS